jgi:hypothetical protein
MIFVLKLFLVPVFVAALSLALPRFGPTVAGLLAGLPIIGGPIFAFMLFEHGQAFGLQAAASTLVGLVPMSAFLVCYAWTCRRLPWHACVPIGWTVFVSVSLALNTLTLSLAQSIAIGLIVPPLVGLLIPRVSVSPPRTPLPRAEIALRMVAAGIMVFAITEIGERSGPQLAGLFMPFPVAASVLAAFSHRLHGGEATVPMLKGIIGGVFGFASFFIVAALTLAHYGAWASLTLSLLGSLAVQGLVFQFVRYMQRRRMAGSI